MHKMSTNYIKPWDNLVGFPFKSWISTHDVCNCSCEQPWRSHCSAICGQWVTKHKRTMHNGLQIAAARFKRNLKGKSSMPNQQICCAKAPFTRLTLPLQCDLRLSAAKRNSITHAAAARSNLDADSKLPNTKELCTTAYKLLRFCSSKTGSRRQSRQTTILKRVLKEI